MGKLEGKVAIVTGATSGMGAGVAELFAREGASVVASGRNVERIRIPDSSTSTGAPATLAAGPSREGELRESDAAVARANTQLDLAEHALAEARRNMSNDFDPLHMVVATRMSRADQPRAARSSSVPPKASRPLA